MATNWGHNWAQEVVTTTLTLCKGERGNSLHLWDHLECRPVCTWGATRVQGPPPSRGPSGCRARLHLGGHQRARTSPLGGPLGCGALLHLGDHQSWGPPPSGHHGARGPPPSGAHHGRRPPPPAPPPQSSARARPGAQASRSVGTSVPPRPEVGTPPLPSGRPAGRPAYPGRAKEPARPPPLSSSPGSRPFPQPQVAAPARPPPGGLTGPR